MPRQGHSIAHLAFGYRAFVLVFLAVALCTHSWGACTAHSNNPRYPLQPSGYVQKSCFYQPSSCGCDNGCDPNWSPSYCSIWQGYCSNGEAMLQGGEGGCPSTLYYSNIGKILSGAHEVCGQYQNICATNYSGCFYDYECTTQAEADSANCVMGGGAWNGSSCEDASDVPASCQDQYQRCTSLKGRWKKISSTSSSCASECNTCGTADVAFRNNQIKVCCDAGEAPPDSAVQCYMPANSGDGMTWSVRADRHNEEAYSCGALTTSDGEAITENQERYQRFCEDGERYEEQEPCIEGVDCGEPGSSSSGSTESSSSFDTELQAMQGLYGVLDTIRDTLVKRLTPAAEAILTCLQTPGLCPGLARGGDTVIVNLPGDSSALRVDTTLKQQIKPLMQDALKNDTLTRSAVVGVGSKIDSLIDSSRKYLKRVADSLGEVNKTVGGLPGGIAKSLDSSISEGYGGVDTNGVSYGWLEGGDSLADSILGGSGYGGLNFSGDSSMRDSLEGLGYVCDDSSCCVGSECIEFDSDSSITDSLNRMVTRLGDSVRQQNADFYNDSVTSMFQEVMDSLRSFNPLGIFDSTLMSTLGSSIPNSNTCPENCSTFQVDIPFFFGTQHAVIDWGLCMGRAVFADGNVLSFLRFIIRIIVAVTCITAVMWNAARIKR